jgi:hypothetical protein
VNSQVTVSVAAVRSVLSRPFARQPLYIWLVWAAAAIVLASCPMLLSDPAMWFYLLDPELLAVIVIIGLRYTRLELSLLSAQIGARPWARTASRTPTQVLPSHSAVEPLSALKCRCRQRRVGMKDAQRD